MTVLAGMCRFSVTLQTPTGQSDSWGKVTYAAGVAYAAFIEYKVRRVLGFDGRVVESTTQVYIPDDVTVEPSHKITLPTGMKPLSPVIVGVEKPSEPGVIHHTVIHLGGR